MTTPEPLDPQPLHPIDREAAQRIYERTQQRDATPAGPVLSSSQGPALPPHGGQTTGSTSTASEYSDPRRIPRGVVLKGGKPA